MAKVTGVLGSGLTPIIVSPLPGRTEGLHAPFPNHLFEAFEVPSIVAQGVQSAAFAGGASGAPHSTGSLLAAVPEVFVGNTGLEWFEHVHVFPGSDAQNPSRLQGFAIDLGNILAQIDTEYEIYNALRRESVTLTAIDDSSVVPGIEEPEVAATDVISPQTSRLAAASTFNTDLTTGLGTPVRTVIRALLAGLPIFDGRIVFSFTPGNDVWIDIAGQRIALLTEEFELPVVESMEFATDIVTSKNGREPSRISLRKNPREAWSVLFRLSDEDRQRFEIRLFDWQDGVFGLPLWHEQTPLTADTVAGATSFSTSGASGVDYRVDGLVCIFTDAGTFDVLQIQSVSDTAIVTTSGAQYAHDAGAVLLPIRQVRLRATPAARRHLVGLTEYRCEFEATDNNTGAPAAATTWNPNTYNSRPLLDDVNCTDGPISETFERRIVVIDNGTGKVQPFSSWDRGKRITQKGFVARSRPEIQELKAFLRYFRGKQRAFYLPTFNEDLTVAAAIGIGTATLDVSHVGMVRFALQRDPKRIFKVTFTDGTSLVREILSAIVVDRFTERLTLNTTWPANRTAAEVQRVQFYELARFDSDIATLEYERVGLARCSLPVRILFDDDA